MAFAIDLKVTTCDMENPFETSKRALNLYENLKKDVEDQSENLLISLPQFLRIGLIEKKSGWYNDINRYDFIVPFNVHRLFPVRSRLTSTLNVCSNIRPISDSGNISVSESGFLKAPVIELNGEEFSVQDFVLSIAYHGTFHYKTDKPRLEKLYREFIKKEHALAFQLGLQIAETFIDSFSAAYKAFKGNTDGHSDKHNQKPIMDRSNDIAKIKFVNAYSQFPINALTYNGTKIYLDVRLDDTETEGVLFAFGNRNTSTVQLLCEYNSRFILVKVRNGSFIQTTKMELTDEILSDFFKLEVIVYCSGKLVISINGNYLHSSGELKTFGKSENKLIVGANLDGEARGKFWVKRLRVAAVY